MVGEEVLGFVYNGQSGTNNNQRNLGPISPQSNQSMHFDMAHNVENRRARPKIVKTSHDHGNMFFI